MDFTAFLGALDATTAIAAIGAVAVIKVGPGFAKWGYGKLISMFR